MKGERRHELERNELADWLVKVFSGIKPYQNAMLGTMLLVVVAWGGYTLWSWPSGGKQATAWDVFHRAVWDLSQGNTSPTEFEAIVDDYPNADAAAWARVMAADLHLAAGCDMLFRNKGIANQELREAVDHYLWILGNDSSSSELRQRATFGLACALESQGNLRKAMDRYEEIGKNWPEGAYAAAAADRLEDLKRPATKLLYDRFAKFDPKPVSSQEPAGPDEPPAFDLDSLKEDGSLFKPKLIDLEEKGAKDKKSQDATTHPEGHVPGPSDGTSGKPADTGPGGTDGKPAGTEPTGTKTGDTEPTGTGSAPVESTGAGATVPAGTEPADSAGPKPEKGQ